jgi:hypothetical protein
MTIINTVYQSSPRLSEEKELFILIFLMYKGPNGTVI